MLQDYIVKTEILERINPTVKDFWPIGIDYGFSSVKGFAPNKVFCFPNCAIEMQGNISDKMLDVTENDIVYRGQAGTYIVGEKAHSIMTSEEAMNYESEMYERNRYFSPVFRVLMDVGLGIALSASFNIRYNGETIIVQTGLPPKYKENDSELLRETLSGMHEFDLKIGTGRFIHYKFEIQPNNVFIIDQPMGSLISAITNNEGGQNQADSHILKSNTLVFDPGFKTLDIYDISSGMYKGSNTFDTLGMYEIYKRTVNTLNKQYHADVNVSNMQNILQKGYVNSFDRRTFSSSHVQFDEILEKNTNDVCDEALQKIFSIYNYLRNYDYMILTGGTGNAWRNRIEEVFSNMQSLTIISANKNDLSLSNTYSNVRGYYLFLVSMLRRNRR